MCEDYPCCGHEAGCCPDYDESGKQVNMKCVCGTTLHIDSRYSICDSCMNQGSDGEYNEAMSEYLEYLDGEGEIIDDDIRRCNEDYYQGDME